MSKTKQTKVPKGYKLKASKKTRPNFKLISYTIKATIPTGQYANIQPEVTVEAETIEQAERAVMPYIETLFARYRDGGVRNIEVPRPVVAQKPVVAPTASVAAAPVAPAPKPPAAPVSAPTAPISAPIAALMVSSAPAPAPMAALAPSAIVMTVPYTRAKGALDSCTSLAALKLVTDQVEKSTKLVDAEKVDLRNLSATKLAQLNGGAK